MVYYNPLRKSHNRPQKELHRSPRVGFKVEVLWVWGSSFGVPGLDLYKASCSLRTLVDYGNILPDAAPGCSPTLRVWGLGFKCELAH